MNRLENDTNLNAWPRLLLALVLLSGCNVYDQGILSDKQESSAASDGEVGEEDGAAGSIDSAIGRDSSVSIDGAVPEDAASAFEDGETVEDSAMDASERDASGSGSDTEDASAPLECSEGREDCDEDPENGCETNLATDKLNCGGCGDVCIELLSHSDEASCTAGVCRVITCQNGWADCDDESENGCEHNIDDDGPCLSEYECTTESFEDHDYFFCSTVGTWSAVRSVCVEDLQGDLATISSSDESGFIISNTLEDSWIGARDVFIEGLWRWEISGVPFWRGQAGGAAQLAQFENWSDDQPDDSSASENCLELMADGGWNDEDCTAERAFICEVSPDECPDDEDKSDPGQCGCGEPDTDSDSDGFAACNDACDSDYDKLQAGTCGCGVPDTNSDSDGYLDCEEECDFDPDKQSAGQCGCGNADTDSDSDGIANCNDGCPSDPNKTSAGQCGCGNADTDGDSDGTANCNDLCPIDPTHTGPCLGYAPANFDPSQINWSAQPTATLTCSSGTVTINTTDPDGTGSQVATITNWNGTAPTPIARTQTNGPEVVVIPLHGLTINSGCTLRLIGSRPVIIAADGSITVNGTIDANASGTTPGAGGNWSCGSSQGGNGTGDTDNNYGASGGGGGAFSTAGGTGGDANTDYIVAPDIRPGGNAGSARGDTDLVPLFGGCAGGRAGDCSTDGGAGGGSVQLSTSGTLDVNGTIRANGANGATPCGASDEGGGTGGGSGGAILLEAATIDTTGATITANGGNGGANGANCGIWGCGSTAGGSGSTSFASPGSNGADTPAGGPGGGGGYGVVRQISH